MDSTPITNNIFERVNAWIQESIMIKLVSIGFLVIILLIPSAWIQDLIMERQQRADEAMTEVASKWSGSQTVSGPVLVIPFRKQEIIDRGKDGKEIKERIERAYFLPNELNIKGEVKPTVLHRGIFDAVVYGSTLNIQSSFIQPDFKSLNIAEDQVLWSDAFLTFGITDLRGISENPVFNAGGNALTAEPANNLGISYSRNEDKATYTTETEAHYSNFSSSGIIAKLNWQNKDSFNGDISLNLSLKGSKQLNFVPAGKTTTAELSGAWHDPSFNGEFLPEARKITDNGFTATWKVLHFNRPFSQQWVEQDQYLGGSEFGVKLLIPVDQYQMSMRTSKYGALIILLTFIALFMVEITQKIRIHPFQYILIGAALTIYYTLLLSFSEHFGYNVSYLIASIATVILISAYSSSFLRSSKLVMIFTSVLVVFYTFIYVIIQQQDFSLLIGSIGLFFIISILMYFSRKINWYQAPVQNELKA
ncbi:cell envelope integrity protein CreD [Chryseosolibacter indicus]|uniref:Cell envelope integrity protein CreD n=1 Tax=Chryseosolibacter indicus TaxID=2782351 RepID=A0ABS5VR99_9BACT|nr:cell envelope integrity protein CreD [Chryseosolibacter indicus]MBT1703978.1 cell envelope integrity protein CreD [Chryseosolibacter indicus]